MPQSTDTRVVLQYFPGDERRFRPTEIDADRQRSFYDSERAQGVRVAPFPHDSR